MPDGKFSVCVMCLGKTENDKLITIGAAEKTIRAINNKLDYIQAAHRER